MSQTSIVRRSIVALGLAGIAVVHILDLPGKWTEVRYLGWSYVAIIAASLFLMERIIVRANRMDYLASAGLAASVIGGFIINRTVGMPRAMDDIGNWLEPLGMLSLFIEGIVVWQSMRAVADMSSRTNAEVDELRGILINA